MKKILILANNDVGLYKFRKELITTLLKDSEVYISLPDGMLVQYLIDMGCHFIDTPVDRRGINPFTDLRLLKKYYSLIKEIKPDMVITYTVKPNVYGGLMARLLHVKYAINITGLGTAFENEGFVKKLVCFLYRLSCKKAHVVFFENEENQNIFIKNKLIQKKQAYLLNGAGVNLNEYAFTPYPIDTDTIRFLFIGRIMKEKGVDELFAVARAIKQQYQNVEFDIVGPMEDNYKEMIQELVDDKIINFYGYQKDVKPFIERCHCFVLPSYHEGMANTLLEAAAMGRPLITSDIHGCKEAVHKNGYLCQVKDQEDLYRKMKQFLELDNEDKKQMGMESRGHMEDVFDKEKVVNQTMKGLYSIIV